MTINHIQPIHFLYYKEEITIAKLSSILERGIAAQLQKEAVMNNLLITGPVCWTYFGFMGDESTPFTLEVAVPVNLIPERYEGAFAFKTSSAFKCVSAMHYGGWMQLPETYGKLMHYITENQLTPSGENRELYLNANFEQAAANITLVQIGIL